MRNRVIGLLLVALMVFSVAGAGCGSSAGQKQPKTETAPEPESKKQEVIKIGYFPNITHAQAVIGFGNGEFQKALGSDVKIETKQFNAGPSAIEALFANEIDLTYIGPNPALNGYIKSRGEALRIVAGAASGGAVFVVRNDSGITSAKDLANRKFASPQLGNTQDVALKNHILKNGFRLKEKGGNVAVVPTANPNILTLFQKKEVDGAWVPEPWGARLVKEGGGKILIDERDLWPDGKFVTAHIIVSTKFLNERPDLLKKFLKAHVELTDWINKNPAEAKRLLNTEIKNLTGKALPEDVLNDAWGRLEVTCDPIKSSLLGSATAAFDLGFLGKEKPDLSGIYDLKFLNEVLRETNRQPIE